MNEKTPFIRIAKREDLPKSRIWMIRAIAFAVAILLGALIFLIAGTNPFTAYGTIIASSLGKITGIRQVIKIAVPLLRTALALVSVFCNEILEHWRRGSDYNGSCCGKFLCTQLCENHSFTDTAPAHGNFRYGIRCNVGGDSCSF